LLLEAEARNDGLGCRPAPGLVARISDGGPCYYDIYPQALYLAGSQLARARQLVGVRADSAAGFSSHGTRVVESVGLRSPRLYTVPARVGGRRRLVRRHGLDAAWSYDARRLAFGLPGDQEIHVGLTSGASDRALGTGSRPRWSVAGQIAAIVPSLDEGGRDNVVIVDPTSGHRRALFAGRPPLRKIFSVDWSPDGSRVVICANGPRDVPDLGAAAFIINADGTGFRRLTAPTGTWSAFTIPAAVWSPDGRWIALGTNDSVYLVSARARSPVPRHSWRRVVRNAGLVDWQALARRPAFTG